MAFVDDDVAPRGAPACREVFRRGREKIRIGTARWLRNHEDALTHALWVGHQACERRKRSLIMCDIPVFYATTRGETRPTAERIAERIRAHGVDSRTIAILSAEASPMGWRQVRGVCLVASLHIGKHQPEAVTFARLHGRTWTALPSLFVSVSQSAAAFHPEEVQVARRLAESFGGATGWTPGCVASVVGRLPDHKHNRLVTWLMRQVGTDDGASADTTRDREWTDWQHIDRVADRLALDVNRRRAVIVVPASIA